MRKISQTDFIAIVAKTNGRCFYCNKKGEEIDHFISKKKWREWNLEEHMGSCDNLENLFLACQYCNASKGSKCPEDFISPNEGELTKGYLAWSRYYKANYRVGLMSREDFDCVMKNVL